MVSAVAPLASGSRPTPSALIESRLSRRVSSCVARPGTSNAGSGSSYPEVSTIRFPSRVPAETRPGPRQAAWTEGASAAALPRRRAAMNNRIENVITEIDGSLAKRPNSVTSHPRWGCAVYVNLGDDGSDVGCRSSADTAPHHTGAVFVRNEMIRHREPPVGALPRLYRRITVDS